MGTLMHIIVSLLFINSTYAHQSIPSMDISNDTTRTFKVQNTIVVSSHIDRQTFVNALIEAEQFAGKIQWSCDTLWIIDTSITKFYKSISAQMFGRTIVGFLDFNYRKLYLPREFIDKSLTHELIHWILGPQQKQWSWEISEFFATCGNIRMYSKYIETDLGFDFDYCDVDDPVLGLNIPTEIPIEHPLYSVRMYTLTKIADDNRDQMPQLIQDASQNQLLNFEDISKFLDKFNIRHSVFHSNKIGFQAHHFLSKDETRIIGVYRAQMKEDNEIYELLVNDIYHFRFDSSANYDIGPIQENVSITPLPMTIDKFKSAELYFMFMGKSLGTRLISTGKQKEKTKNCKPIH